MREQDGIDRSFLTSSVSAGPSAESFCPAAASEPPRARCTSPDRFTWIVLLVGASLLLWTVAALRADELPARASRTDRFRASGAVRALSIEGVSGDVEVGAGESFDATVEVTVHAASKRLADEILAKTKVDFVDSEGRVSLVADAPEIRPRASDDGRPAHRASAPDARWGRRGEKSGGMSDGRFSVNVGFHVTLPRSAELEVEIVNGNVRCSGIGGTLALRSVNGNIEAEGAGDAPLRFETVNGNVEASLASLSRGRAVRAESVNGNVSLTVPRGVGFRFRGRTMTGDILSTFPLPVREAREDRRVSEEIRRAMDDVERAKEQIRAKAERGRREVEAERKRLERERRRVTDLSAPDDGAIDVALEIDFEKLEADLERAAAEIAEASSELARSVAANIERFYEGTIGDGGAEVVCSTLNGRISLLAEGTKPEQAKRLLGAFAAGGNDDGGEGLGTVIEVRGGHSARAPRRTRVTRPTTPIPPAPPAPPAPPEKPPHVRRTVPPAPPVPPAAPLPPIDIEEGSIVRGDIETGFEADIPSGDIRLGRVTGQVKASTQSGSIRVVSAGRRAELATAGGDIMIGAVGGPVEATTFGGDIEVGEARGEARLETMGGDVRVGACSGSVIAKTGGGDVELRRIAGGVRAETAGGSIVCEIIGRVSAGVSLRTGGGDVDLILPAAASASVDVQVVGVEAADDHIVSEFPGLEFSKTKGAQKATGTIGTGGAKVTIRANSGTVTLRRGA